MMLKFIQKWQKSSDIVELEKIGSLILILGLNQWTLDELNPIDD